MNTHEIRHQKNLNKEVEDIKENQMEILELKRRGQLVSSEKLQDTRAIYKINYIFIASK
jgi:hypothetical protein